MSKLEKLLQRIVNNPKTVRFEELNKLLKNKGFTRRQSRKGSSHYIYTKDDKFIVVPYKQPYIKCIYVERVIDLLNECFEGDHTDE